MRLPGWFSHLLPEGRLREAVANAAGVHKEREFFLLERIGGDDLPGGVRVVEADAAGAEPTGDTDEPVPAVEGDLGPLKFSLAGVQLKFSVSSTDRGLTIPARGEAGDWIAKLPDQRPGHEGVPEAELAGLELARASGIGCPKLGSWRLQRSIVCLNGRPRQVAVALLIERFDRTPGGGRVHVEELAQVLRLPTGNPDFKYERLNFLPFGTSVTLLLNYTDAGPAIIERLSSTTSSERLSCRLTRRRDALRLAVVRWPVVPSRSERRA